MGALILQSLLRSAFPAARSEGPSPQSPAWPVVGDAGGVARGRELSDAQGGGLSTKIHHAVDGRLRPLAILVGPGKGADSPMFLPR